MRNVFFVLLLLICIAPASAEDWELTFENSDYEVGPYSDLISSESPSSLSLNTIYRSSAAVSCPRTSTPTATFTLNHGFDSYFAYTYYSYGSFRAGSPVQTYYRCPTQTCDAYNSTGSLLFSFTYQPSPGGGSYGTTAAFTAPYNRIEFVRGLSGYTVYVNGVTQASFPLNISNQVDHLVISETLVFYSWTSQYMYLYYDDFTTHPFILGGSDKLVGDSYALTYGIAASSARTQFLKLFAPDGSIISTTDLGHSTSGSCSFDSSTFSSPGVYTFRLYAIYTDGSKQFLCSKSVTSGESTSTTDCIIELDESSYSAGDEISIYTFTSPWDSGYQLKLYSKSRLEKTISITSQDQNSKYVIPDDALSESWLVQLIAPDGSTETAVSFSVLGNLYPDTALKFERDAYTIDDKVRIFYDDLPPETTVLLRGSRADPTKVFEKQWDDRTGTGTLTYQLTGQDIQYLEVWASCQGSVLASDLVRVSQGSDYILSGAVYDALSNVPLPGVMIGLSGDMHYTNEAGRYSLTLPAGSNYIQLFKDGYHSDSLNLTLSNPTTSRNWYIIPVTSETGGTLYGATANYADGSPVGSVYVRIYNESDGTSHSMLTKSSTGYYSFDSLPIGSTWTLEASKTDYDNYKATVTVSGETLHLVRMISENYDPNAPPVSTPGDGTGSSTTTDRPSRAAARESLNWLEETIPSLVKLVVVIFMMALMGMKL